jgi:hypothetical protein
MQKNKSFFLYSQLKREIYNIYFKRYVINEASKKHRDGREEERKAKLEKSYLLI